MIGKGAIATGSIQSGVAERIAGAPTGPVETELFVGGEVLASADRIDVVDPARPGLVVGSAAAASEQQARAAVGIARAAFPAWAALGAAARAQLIAGAFEGAERFRDEDARVLTLENGKIFQESWTDFLVLDVRTRLALGLVDRVEEEQVLAGPPVTTTVQHQPLGVVTIIVPFNWPLAILGAALPYALLAGNSVIVKPPPSTPLAMTRALTRIAAQLPPGVLNVVTGRDADLAPLVSNDDVAKVCFTGSVGGGKAIMGLAAASLTRVTLELGGNDPALVLDDAVLDDGAVDRLFSGCFDTTGQICMNAKRVYVHRSRYDELVGALADRLDRVVLGHGLSPSTTMGPLHQQRQRDYVDGLVAEARASGAEVRASGVLPADLPDGRFVRPALVLDPDPSLRVVREEQFGPVLPLVPFDRLEDAVRAADDTWAGLCASVWTSDPSRAKAVAGQLQVGTVFVNDHGAQRLDLRSPFGGMRSSGFGREQGIVGVREFQDTRAVGELHLDGIPVTAAQPG